MAAVETNVNQEESSSFDFSSPWNMMSDVVLLIEGERFNVHRSILAVWSPVFAKMFTADFKERNDTEIPLPGKKADEIQELLQVIYPTIMKPISQENCYFLLVLADEYQMEKVKEKCEEFLVGKLSELDSHNILVLSQQYDLKKLLAESKNQMKKLTLEEITKHEKYQEISKEALCDVLIDKVATLEVELAQVKQERYHEVATLEVELAKVKQERLDTVATLEKTMRGLQNEKESYNRLKRDGKEMLESVIVRLGNYVITKHKQIMSIGPRDIDRDIETTLYVIKHDHGDSYGYSRPNHNCTNQCLSLLSGNIQRLYSLLK